jgi:hypothetical protein
LELAQVAQVRSLLDTHDLSPLGTRYFLNTEQKCSNGATMSDYFDGVTRGDSLGQHVKDGLASAGMPGLRGLAFGMLENAEDALDPRPIMSAVTATGYPVCQQVACPVGDYNGALKDPTDPTISYVVDPVQYDVPNTNGPTQTRWVMAYDGDGNPLTVTKDEYGASPKCYNPDGSYLSTPPAGCVPPDPTVNAAGSGRYNLCRVVQQPTLPPTMSSTTVPTVEGFRSNTETALIGVSIAALALIVGWKVLRSV